MTGRGAPGPDGAASRIAEDPRPVLGVGMKMHLGYAASRRYLADVAVAADRLRAVSVFVLPSFPLLPAARDLLAGTGVAHGAQDGHWEDAGPHTGSVSPAMLAELDCSVVEVGHAERRRDFHEDDAMIARKAAAASRWGLVPVVCVGERDEHADAPERVRRQVEAVLDELPDDAPMLIAYEPIWAIGAERAAGPAHVARVLDAVRIAGAGRRGGTRLLYGGAATPETAEALLGAGADGLFASRAALTTQGLLGLVARMGATRRSPRG